MTRSVENVFLPDEAATVEFGKKISTGFRPGDIVKLTGPLGAGKTTLVRGIMSGMGGNPAEVHSPTFSLMHEYSTPRTCIIHCDFYRLPAGNDLEDLGGLELFDAEKLVLVEWPEQMNLRLPSDRVIFIRLEMSGSGRIVSAEFPRNISD